MIELLHADAALVAVHKPAGIPAVPDKTGDESALEMASEQCGRELRPVHRIDRPAGGIVLFAATREAAAAMSAEFADGKAARRYEAIVYGRPVTDTGDLSHSLAFDARTNRSRVVQRNGYNEGAREARLSYRVIARGERYSLLEVTLHTGRHHQIRAQLSAAGHPIRGDVKYGARRGLPGRIISLYATELSVSHPDSGEIVMLEVVPRGDDLWQRLASITE